jgi:2-succinyl-5-enolpyruvyl-6-hydroxy-3-cyclohexene-1-carboxylate synthase
MNSPGANVEFEDPESTLARTVPNERNRNAVWCRAIIEELAHSGLTHVVICPGGRSAAMAATIAAQPQLSTIIHTDERSGAFFALGLIKAFGRPVAICTTSGSAVANLLPATVEADACNLPLILLTCDRPHAQREAGAPQVTDPIGLCQAVVRASLDLDDPEADDEPLRSLRRRISEVRRHFIPGKDLGPIHINIPLRGSVTSMDLDQDWNRLPLSKTALFGKRDELGRPVPMMPLAKFQPVSSLPAGLKLCSGLKGLIVAGPDPPITNEQAAQLSVSTGFPLLADAPSGFRRPDLSPNLVCEADLLALDSSLARCRADLIIRLGAAPISYTLHRYLSAQTCPTIKVVQRPESKDFLSRDFHTVSPSREILSEMAKQLHSGDPDWLQLWLSRSELSQRMKESYFAGLSWGECQAANSICNNLDFNFLHLGNSMAVRHGNLFCRPSARTQRIFANRGVNGIDGTISTFLGELAGLGGCGLLLMGDLSFLHDLPALEACKAPNMRGAICVLNNGGGALFDLLDCHEMADYTRIMRNPCNLNFEDIASAFRIDYRRCEDRGQLEAALSEVLSNHGLTLIEVCVPPDSLHRELTGLYLERLQRSR